MRGGSFTQINILRKINDFDNYILLFFKRKLQNKYLDVIMPSITCLGNLGLLWIVIAILLLLNQHHRTAGTMVLVTLLTCTFIGEGMIKNIVKRCRPCNRGESIKLLIQNPVSYSFPSGHTVSSFAVANILSIYFTQYMLIFMGIAILIALSRIYLYVHYPSDVIAGVILGVICSKLVLIFYAEHFIVRILKH